MNVMAEGLHVALTLCPRSTQECPSVEQVLDAWYRRHGWSLRLCLERGCPNPATSKGRCDLHRRGRERKRSQERQGVRNPYTEATERRDQDPDYRPSRHRDDSQS